VLNKKAQVNGALLKKRILLNGGTYFSTLEGKKQHYDKGYYDSLAASKKDGAKSIVKARKDTVAEEKTVTREMLKKLVKSY